MQLRFVIKKNIKTVIWVEIFLFCTFGFLRDIIGLPGAIAYLLDILNCGIFAWTILAHSSRVKKRWICGKFLGVTIAIFGIYVLLNYFVVGPFSPLLFFGGLETLSDFIYSS